MARTWFITGASRGLGAEIVRAAVRAGDQVVAARHPEIVGSRLELNQSDLRCAAWSSASAAQMAWHAIAA